MGMKRWRFGLALVPLVLAALGGCGGERPKAGGPKDKTPKLAQQDSDGDGPGGKANAHSGWWCDEHGVPEEVCTRCNAKLVARFKAEGDWCKKHDRPDSQCFLCHPEKEAEWAAKYELKFGKKPPKPEPEKE
jgi:hypothetical protein